MSATNLVQLRLAQLRLTDENIRTLAANPDLSTKECNKVRREIDADNAGFLGIALPMLDDEEAEYGELLKVRFSR